MAERSESSSPSLHSGPENALVKKPTEVLLVVFIHGFKGTDTTFAQFPQRLQHVLSESVPSTAVECVVFPAYETKGALDHAVVRFSDWLTTLTVEKEVAHGTGSGSAKIVLCGHSMGGLLAADSLLSFANSRPDKEAPLWPKIIACLAFDTPYLGLHPYVFKNTATKAAQAIGSARTFATGLFGSAAAAGIAREASSPSNESPKKSAPLAITAPPPPEKSKWSKWAPAALALGGGLVTAAAAGAAYYRKEDLGAGYGWATDHMRYVGNLWDEEALKKRIKDLLDAERQFGVIFRTFYTVLPPSPPMFLSSRTFIVLPARDASYYSHFVPARNAIAVDELQAHTGMFAASTNDGYYDLGLETAKYIREGLYTRHEVDTKEEDLLS